MKILIDRDIPYIRGVLEPFAQVTCLEGGAITPADVADAQALVVRTRTKCNRALLEGSAVKLIATATIGYDHIDIDYCRKAGIAVSTAAGSNARGVLQWMGGVLAFAAGQQGWTPEQKCIGVVGVGNVGSLVASYARLWGFDVLCCDPPRRQARETGANCGCDGNQYQPDEFVPQEKIISDCDIITFHTPLIKDGADKTYHMAGSDFFDRINPGTLIINSSRGEVIDTRALVGALEKGKCSSCIDTWEGEPDIDPGLLSETLVATPHIAGYSAQGKANASSMAVQAVARQFGLPLTEWHPYDLVPKVEPRPISWKEMRSTIKEYFDVGQESRALKENPGGFEALRNNYRYRTEYF